MADNRFSHRLSSSGATAPVTLIMLAIVGSLAIATLLFIRGSTVAAHRQYYARLAAVGADSAIQLAKERYLDNPDYNGTPELTLAKTDDYRLTVSVEVVSTSLDGLSKTIRGRGAMYVRDVSSTQAYTYEVQTATIHGFAQHINPEHYGPLAWFDAQSPKYRPLGASTTTIDAVTPTVDSSMNQAVYEELQHDGSLWPAAWDSDDVSLDGCESAEVSIALCSAAATKHQLVGMVFNSVPIAAQSPIITASISLPLKTQATQASTYKLCGFYAAADNPHPPLFSKQSSQQLTVAANNPALHTTACSTFTTQANWPRSDLTIDVTAVAQEIIRHSNWVGSPTAHMGFYISYVSGEGTITVAKQGVRLAITSGDTASAPAIGAPVGEWWDHSGHELHARLAPEASSAPATTGTGSETGLAIGASPLAIQLPADFKTSGYSIFAVVTPPQNSSSTKGSLLADRTSDATLPLINFDTHPLSLSTRPWNQSVPQPSQTASLYCSSSKQRACQSSTVLAVATASLADASIISDLRANGQSIATVSTAAQPSDAFVPRQLLIGDHQLADQPVTYHEVIIYDHPLTCRQTEAIEQYLRSKWGLGSQAWPSNCPSQQIPLE